MRTRTKLHIPGTDISLGDLAKDELTGFEGIATAHIRNLTGCDTVWLTSRTLTQKDSVMPEERCFDVMRLVLVETNPMEIKGFPDDVPASG